MKLFSSVKQWFSNLLTTKFFRKTEKNKIHSAKTVSSVSDKKEVKAEQKLEDYFEIVTSDETRLKEFQKLLKQKIKDAKKNPSSVLNDINILSVFVRDIIEERPDLKDIANKQLDKEAKKLSEGIYKDEAIITKLVNELREVTTRTADTNNVPYDTFDTDLNASLYAEAIYRAFKDEVADLGVNAQQFRRALDSYLNTDDTYLLYEEYTSTRGRKDRSTKLKAPREIVKMATNLSLKITYK